MSESTVVCKAGWCNALPQEHIRNNLPETIRVKLTVTFFHACWSHLFWLRLCSRYVKNRTFNIACVALSVFPPPPSTTLRPLSAGTDKWWGAAVSICVSHLAKVSSRYVKKKQWGNGDDWSVWGIILVLPVRVDINLWSQAVAMEV